MLAIFPSDIIRFVTESVQVPFVSLFNLDIVPAFRSRFTITRHVVKQTIVFGIPYLDLASVLPVIETDCVLAEHEHSRKGVFKGFVLSCLAQLPVELGDEPVENALPAELYIFYFFHNRRNGHLSSQTDALN